MLGSSRFADLGCGSARISQSDGCCQGLTLWPVDHQLPHRRPRQQPPLGRHQLRPRVWQASLQSQYSRWQWTSQRPPRLQQH